MYPILCYYALPIPLYFTVSGLENNPNHPDPLIQTTPGYITKVPYPLEMGGSAIGEHKIYIPVFQLSILLGVILV